MSNRIKNYVLFRRTRNKKTICKCIKNIKKITLLKVPKPIGILEFRKYL